MVQKETEKIVISYKFNSLNIIIFIVVTINI